MKEAQCTSWGEQLEITLKDEVQEQDFLPK